MTAVEEEMTSDPFELAKMEIEQMTERRKALISSVFSGFNWIDDKKTIVQKKSVKCGKSKR